MLSVWCCGSLSFIDNPKNISSFIYSLFITKNISIVILIIWLYYVRFYKQQKTSYIVFLFLIKTSLQRWIKRMFCGTKKSDFFHITATKIKKQFFNNPGLLCNLKKFWILRWTLFNKNRPHWWKTLITLLNREVWNQ